MSCASQRVWKIAPGYAQNRAWSRVRPDALFVVAEGRLMLRLLAVLVALCWAACTLPKRSGWAERRRKGHTPALTSPKGYEYRRVNRLGAGCWRYRCA